MTLGGMDVLHLAWGLALFVVPGALWSRVLFRKMSLAGRVALGFGLSLVAVTGTVLLLSLAVAVSGPVVYGVVALYGGFPWPGCFSTGRCPGRRCRTGGPCSGWPCSWESWPSWPG